MLPTQIFSKTGTIQRLQKRRLPRKMGHCFQIVETIGLGGTLHEDWECILFGRLLPSDGSAPGLGTRLYMGVQARAGTPHKTSIIQLESLER